MAGHSKFKNIMHRKGAQDKKRAAMFTKMAREISAAAKSGNLDPEFNPRLRTAIAAAKGINMPKDRIENALQKAASGPGGDNYEQMRYEGYGPGRVAIIVEALTDNKNRTAGEVRSVFTKFGGSMGETGSLRFIFKHIGFISYKKGGAISNLDQLLEAILEFDIEEVEELEDCFEVVCKMENFHHLLTSLEKKFGEPDESGIVWRPENVQHIEDLELATKIIKFIDLLEDNDDVQNVTANFTISEAIIKKLEE